MDNDEALEPLENQLMKTVIYLFTFEPQFTYFWAWYMNSSCRNTKVLS